MPGPVLPRVLLVDDYVPFRKALRRRLGARYELVEAASCEEAIEILRRDGDFAAMLLDVGFGPDHARGDQVLPSLLARWPLIPIVVVTVENAVTTAVSCLEAGAAAFVSKLNPDMPELEPKIERAVALGQALRREAERLAALALAPAPPLQLAAPVPPLAASALPAPAAAPAPIRPIEDEVREICERAVERCGGSLRKAALSLGIPYSSFRRRMKKWRNAQTSD